MPSAIRAWDTTDKLPLTDYSARLWSGLVGGLYRERWRVWLEELVAARHERRAPDEAALTVRIDEVTEAFLAGTARRSPAPAGGPLAELRRLATAYRSA